MKFKLNLKKLRQQKGLTQKDLADKLKIDQSVISDFERGIFNPSLERLVELSLILDCSLDDMIIYEKTHDEYSKELLNMKNNNEDHK